MQMSHETEDAAGMKKTRLLTGNTHCDVWPARDIYGGATQFRTAQDREWGVGHHGTRREHQWAVVLRLGSLEEHQSSMNGLETLVLGTPQMS